MTQTTCVDSGKGSSGKKVLIYACSGAGNVAQIAHLAARHLTRQGQGNMFCLAGLGAGISGMVQTARAADLNLVLDSCPQDCARLIFQNLGLTKPPA